MTSLAPALWAIFFFAPASAGALSFELRPTTAAAVAQPFSIEGSAQIGEGFSLTLSSAVKEAGPFFIIKAEAKPAGEGGKPTTLQVRLELMAFDYGDLQLPPLPWTLTDAAGKSDTFNSPPVKVHVPKPEGAGKGDIRDIKPPLSPPKWLYVLAVLIILAAAAALYFLWRRLRRGKGPLLAPEPVDTRLPHEIALAELEALAGQTQPRIFYDRVSEILRIYFERRFFIPAPTLTTGELIRQMKEAEIEHAPVSSSRELFDRADLVKFAKFTPERSDIDRDLAAAIDIVRSTTPPPPQPQSEKMASPG